LYRFWTNIEQGRVWLTTSVVTSCDSAAGNMPGYCRTYIVKYVRKGNSFVLADLWRGNQTLLDRSHLKTEKAWKMSQFLCTVRCVSPSGFPFFLLCVILFLHPCWFKVLLKQSHACQTDGQTRCSNLVSGICKGKYMYRYFQNVSPKKYCRLYIQLPCQDAKLLFVESGERGLRGGGWGGKKMQRRRRRNTIRIQTFLSK